MFLHLAPPLNSRSACRQMECFIILKYQVLIIHVLNLRDELWQWSDGSVKYEMTLISHPVQSCTVSGKHEQTLQAFKKESG